MVESREDAKVDIRISEWRQGTRQGSKVVVVKRADMDAEKSFLKFVAA
jgi:hypothetical protein